MIKKRTTSASWVRAMAEVFAVEGLDVDTLLVDAEIDAATLQSPGARLSTDKISRLWELAVERSGKSWIALAQHRVARPASFDVVGYTMMSCANLRAAFERLIRYLRILSDAVTVMVRDEAALCRLSIELQAGDRPAPRQRMEYILITLTSFCRWVSGDRVNPRRVEIAFPAPPDPAPHQEAFGCPVSFGTRTSALLFATVDVNRPLPTSNPTLAALHERFAGDYLEHFGRDETSTRVRELIVRRLPDGEPRRDEVARELCLSERTLQRRLGEESTSFHQLLDETRRELAEQYLRRLQLSLGQAAYLLGFPEESSFHRACRRWFGLPPGQYRARIASATRRADE